MAAPAAPLPGERGPGAAGGGERDPSMHACLKKAARSARSAALWRHESDLIFANLHLAATSALSERMVVGEGGPLTATAERLWAEAAQLRMALIEHRDFAAMSCAQRDYTRGRIEAVTGRVRDDPPSAPWEGGADQTDCWAAAAGADRPRGPVGGLTSLFMESLQAGWPLRLALTRWAGLGSGSFSPDALLPGRGRLPGRRSGGTPVRAGRAGPGRRHAGPGQRSGAHPGHSRLGWVAAASPRAGTDVAQTVTVGASVRAPAPRGRAAVARRDGTGRTGSGNARCKLEAQVGRPPSRH